VKATLIAALILLGGCSSVFDLTGGSEGGPHAFGGVRTWPEDVSKVLDIPMTGERALNYLLLYLYEGLIDLPSSLAGDIALLPITVVFEIFRN
jgi:uncharacterized protein YceK